VRVKAEGMVNWSTLAPLATTFSIEPFSSSSTPRQLCTRTSLHISFLRSEKRVGNAGAPPDSDVKTEAIEPSSFGLRAGVYVDVIVRNLSEACWYVHGSLRTPVRGA
jgi:hypothetical protein